MSDPIPGRSITLNLDGQDYDFRLDFTAMADFEEATGKGVLELFGEVFSALQGAATADLGSTLGSLKLKAKDLQALAWACLGGDDSGMDLRAAGRLVHAGNLQAVIVALTEALRDALPEVEGEQSHPPPVLVGPDGPPSGPSEDSASA